MKPRPSALVITFLIAIVITSCADQRKPWTAKNLYEAITSAEAEKESWK